jgi:TPR repeat protein
MMATKVFISYRRDDSKYQARMIHAAFCQVLPRDHVFMDVDTILPGANFRKILRDWVNQCEVLLALIGPGWIDASDPKTKGRRLDNPSDFVRIEIGEALARDVPVVPVLIDGTPMPDISLLPDDLKELVDRQAEFVEYRTFDADVERLIRRLRLDEGGAQTKRRLDEADAEKRRRDEGERRRQEVEIKQRADEEEGRRKAEVEECRRDEEANAMYNRGELYYYGRGVAQDYAKAREWYEKAAAKGDASAMNNLGDLYDYGRGVVQDHAKAREWYEKAAAKDNASAMNNLGSLYRAGFGVAQDYAKALEWYEKAAARGDARAMRNLGSLYEHGRGVAQDYAKAREWYEKAAARGEALAKEYLKRPLFRFRAAISNWAGS